MINTTSNTVITCDKCEKVVAAGDQWFQVSLLISSGIFDGGNSGLAELTSTAMQACKTCYPMLCAAPAAVLQPAGAVAAAPSLTAKG